MFHEGLGFRAGLQGVWGLTRLIRVSTRVRVWDSGFGLRSLIPEPAGSSQEVPAKRKA